MDRALDPVGDSLERGKWMGLDTEKLATVKTRVFQRVMGTSSLASICIAHELKRLSGLLIPPQ